MRIFCLVLTGTILLSGCGSPPPTRTTGTTPVELSTLSETTVQERLLNVLQEMTPEEALGRSDQLKIPNLALVCHNSRTIDGGDIPLLVCEWGEGFNSLSERSITWWQEGAWHAQPYPADALQGFAYVKRFQQDRDSLLVVVNTAGYRMTEVVHLLRLEGGAWSPVWQMPEATMTNGGSEILMKEDSQGFVLYEWGEDLQSPTFRSEWQRSNYGFSRAAHREITPQEATVRRFVSALIRQDDILASQMTIPSTLLDTARDLRIGELASVGFDTTSGESPEEIYLLTDQGARWLFHLEPRGIEWLVTMITPSL